MFLSRFQAVGLTALRVTASSKLSTFAAVTGARIPSGMAGASDIGELRHAGVIPLIHTNRETGVIEKWSVRVDVTEEFPFLVTKLSPYYDR